MTGPSAPYIIRQHRFSWYVKFPSSAEDGMATATGPYLTRWGAQLSLRISERGGRTWSRATPEHPPDDRNPPPPPPSRAQ